MNIEQLAEEYEKNIGYVVCSAASPTEKSVKFIEQELGIKLPTSFVLFAKASKHYGNWLASIGPDYESRSHMLTINRELRDEGKIPTNFVAINVGYDEEYSCIDRETYDQDRDEYLITYWASDVPPSESKLNDSFPSYMEENIKFWAKNS